MGISTKILSLLFCLFVGQFLGIRSAQAADDTQFRLYYFTIFPTMEKSRFSMAGAWHGNPDDKWNRFEFRTTKTFFIIPKLDMAFGQRSNIAFREGSFSNYELRPFQTFTFKHLFFPHFTMDHRLMVEERLFFNNGAGFNPDFQGRARYRLDMRFPFQRLFSFSDRWYLRPMSELFYNFGTDQESHISQWKNTMAFGYLLRTDLTMEFRFEKSLNWNNPDFSYGTDLNIFRLQLVKRISRTQ